DPGGPENPTSGSPPPSLIQRCLDQPRRSHAASSLSITGTHATVPDKVPRALNFSPDGKRLYFTEAGASAVQVLDPTTNTIVDQIPVGTSPHQPLFVGAGQTALVVVQGPGQLAVVDTANKTVTAVPVGQMPHWIAVSSDGRFAYVTNENSSDVSIVSIDNKKVIAGMLT
ncbi:MAG: hypothetical protein M3083_22010, partial [Actinomycetota bacterium]|nr:hypothetical protein [Actinomycetota bacterium]